MTKRIALTGFMGVGKSSVARHLAHRLKLKWTDLDRAIEDAERKSVAEIIDGEGLDAYRDIESRVLQAVVDDGTAGIISLGGGTFTLERNREILKAAEIPTVWLEASFEHSWLNITFSKKDRPLARDKESARQLFDERQKIYCLAEWHFVVRPDSTSFEVARQIEEQMFS